MVATAERMGFEVGEGAGAGRSSAAVSWCFHEELAEQLIRRMAPHVPWAVAIHSPDSPAPRADQLPDLNGVAPWVRSTGGVPEGMYTLAGLNCRMRVYRYESDGGDRFLPHYDECWPGSRLRLGADGEACLEQDGWRYSSAATAGDPHGDRWAWSATDRVSQLTVLLYLNDDFEGGETVLYPGQHKDERPTEGGVSVSVRPATGSILCFGQTFKFNRARVPQPVQEVQEVQEGLGAPCRVAAAPWRAPGDRLEIAWRSSALRTRPEVGRDRGHPP